MLTLNDVGLIGANTTRTKAYIQVLLKNGYRLGNVYLMTKEPEKLREESRGFTPGVADMPYFDPDEPLLTTMEQSETPVTFLDTDNINEVDYSKIPETYLIYSGFGGQILKPRLFETGKKFVHVHAGILPQYRGSTTIYYSILKENICGATAIFLEPGIDVGNIITMKRFPLPPASVNVDYIYEPYTRAQVLVEAVRQYAENGEFGSVKQEQGDANTYFIIHPTLKHIALKRISGD